MSLNPIVLDLEFSGLDMEKCGVWQIGALDFNTGETFLEESKIDDEDSVEDGALKVVGKTEDELRDKNKQTQQQMIANFFGWMASRQMKNVLCQNPAMDVGFLRIRAKKYGLSVPFKYRSFDLHTIAQIIYHKLNNQFSIMNDSSNMSLGDILNFCGMQDERIEMSGDEIVKQGNPHNALEDAKLTAECFSRLVYGKGLFPEYSKFEVPEVLRK